MRCTARAVKAAQFAFTGAERTAFTEQAGGEARSYGRAEEKAIPCLSPLLAAMGKFMTTYRWLGKPKVW